MTLDEWKSMEEAKRVKAEFNIRKAGEGCSGDPQWKKMFVLTKKEKSEVHDDDEDQQVKLFCCLALVTTYRVQKDCNYNCQHITLSTFCSESVSSDSGLSLGEVMFR